MFSCFTGIGQQARWQPVVLALPSGKALHATNYRCIGACPWYSSSSTPVRVLTDVPGPSQRQHARSRCV